MLRAVATDAEVGWGVGTEGLVPDFLLVLAAPASSDRVTEEHELGFAFLGDADELLMGSDEARVDLAVFAILLRRHIRWLRWHDDHWRGCRDGRSRSLCLDGCGGEEKEGECEVRDFHARGFWRVGGMEAIRKSKQLCALMPV